MPRLQPCVSRPQPYVLRWLRVGRLDCPECKLSVRSRRAFARDERVDCLVSELLTSFSADPADMTEEQVANIAKVHNPQPTAHSVQCTVHRVLSTTLPIDS